ncbi:MAG: CpsD/CapB family tyrosine-protein kinase [Acidobacteriaceae bacterium]|nr:CpsD/CapB family tyrosine-protein kinase [Acidobacteriaceae bacterium]
MSRVHDALRKAAQENPQPAKPAARIPKAPLLAPDVLAASPEVPAQEKAQEEARQQGAAAQAGFEARPGIETPSVEAPPIETSPTITRSAPLFDTVADLECLEEFILDARQVAFDPLPEALLMNPARPRATPAEEFRSLRTRLNHLQTIQPLHTLVVTSPSPAEGKSFTAMNLAVAQAQLAEKRVLLADFDFRRPTIDNTFRLAGQPGLTDYLEGKVRISDIINKVGDTSFYVMPAGSPVPNPLELLNLRECRALVEALRSHFDWIIFDTPPLLFAADANLLATMADGTILVVRIGATTFESVSRAMHSLCENNILGVVVNGARRSELYSKYSYYHDYYYSEPEPEKAEPPASDDVVVAHK